MPIFEYTCDSCGHPFEKLVMTPGSEVVLCVKCGGRKVTRRLSTFSARSGSGSRRDLGMAPPSRGGPSGGGCGSGSCGCG